MHVYICDSSSCESDISIVENDKQVDGKDTLHVSSSTLNSYTTNMHILSAKTTQCPLMVSKSNVSRRKLRGHVLTPETPDNSYMHS